MPIYPTQPEPHDDSAQQAADAQYYRHVLHDLIDMGTDLAHLLHQQATAQAARPSAAPTQQATEAQPAPAPAPAPDAAPDPIPDLTVSFDRTARAIRRSIALARTLAGPVPLARDPAQHRAGVRKRILREVEDAIQRTSGAECPDADSLHVELLDRLDAPDLDDDINDRPVADIIADICRDLGLAPLTGDHPWKRRTPEDIQQFCTRAAAPSRTRQPGAAQPGRPTAPPHAPADPQPANPAPIGPAAIPRATGPVSDAPADAADPIATILPAHARNRWRPPPEI